MDTLFNRAVSAAMLDVEFFRRAESDISLNQEALIVVILVSLAGSIGGFIGGLMGGGFGSALLALIVALIVGVANYYIWAYITHFVGTQLFHADVNPGELLRVLGYASGPRVLNILSFIPCIGPLISLAGGLWALVAGFVGAREALDLDTTKTLITVVIGWVVITVIRIVMFSILGVGGLVLGAVGSILGGR